MHIQKRNLLTRQVVSVPDVFRAVCEAQLEWQLPRVSLTQLERQPMTNCIALIVTQKDPDNNSMRKKKTVWKLSTQLNGTLRV